MNLKFVKCHGLGNDFVLIDAFSTNKGLIVSKDLACFLGDRRQGVGCDQILILRPPVDKSNNAYMEILNSDGSLAEMCGNGIRAAALYMSHSSFRSPFKVETLAGLKTVVNTGIVDEFKVNMGTPWFFQKEGKIQTQELTFTLPSQSRSFRFYEVSVGNPHAVISVANLQEFDFTFWGPLIENHPRFINKTNVEFFEFGPSQVVHARVWERGAGATRACGTGACAVGLVVIESIGCSESITVRLPGGDLIIDYVPGGDIFMTGKAALSYQGSLEWDDPVNSVVN